MRTVVGYVHGPGRYPVDALGELLGPSVDGALIVDPERQSVGWLALAD